MKVEQIELTKIKFVENIRQNFPVEEQSQLMQSIKQEGLLEPIGLQKKGSEFLVVWGHRRFLAFEKLGYNHIDAVILEGETMTEEEFIIKNATENIHHFETSVLELGRICTFLRKTMSPSEIAVKMAIPKTRVLQALNSYSNIPKNIQKKVKVFGSADKSKGRNGMLPFHIAVLIANMRTVSVADKNKLYEIVRKDELKIEHIRVLETLLEDDVPFDEAVKHLSGWKVTGFKLAIKKEIAEDINKKHGSVPRLVADLINQVYPNSTYKNQK